MTIEHWREIAQRYEPTDTSLDARFARAVYDRLQREEQEHFACGDQRPTLDPILEQLAARL